MVWQAESTVCFLAFLIYFLGSFFFSSLALIFQFSTALALEFAAVSFAFRCNFTVSCHFVFIFEIFRFLLCYGTSANNRRAGVSRVLGTLFWALAFLKTKK